MYRYECRTIMKMQRHLYIVQLYLMRMRLLFLDTCCVESRKPCVLKESWSMNCGLQSHEPGAWTGIQLVWHKHVIRRTCIWV